MRYILYLSFIYASILCGCEKNDNVEKIYRFNGRMQSGGFERAYLLNLPPVYYDRDESYPLVIGLHGTGGKAIQFAENYGFIDKADRENFIVLLPEGIRSAGPFGIRTWNAGSCCGPALENNVDDVGFIRQLVDSLKKQFRIDPKRIYVTGMSNGGMFAYRLACELSTDLAAVAVVAGTSMTSSCSPARAIPLLHIHAKDDMKVPPGGGEGLGGYIYTSLDSTLNRWSALNGCHQLSFTTEQRQGYIVGNKTDCSNNTSITYYLTDEGGHSWPGSVSYPKRGDKPSNVINATDLIFDFFKKHQLE